MVKVNFYCQENNITAYDVEGHIEKFNQVQTTKGLQLVQFNGAEVFCGIISAITQMTYMYLAKHSMATIQEFENGKFRVNCNCPMLNPCMEMLHDGLQDLARQYPDQLQVKDVVI